MKKYVVTWDDRFEVEVKAKNKQEALDYSQEHPTPMSECVQDSLRIEEVKE